MQPHTNVRAVCDILWKSLNSAGTSLLVNGPTLSRDTEEHVDDCDLLGELERSSQDTKRDLMFFRLYTRRMVVVRES